VTLKSDIEALTLRKECLKKSWNAPIYAFYESTPDIGHDGKGQHFHQFQCLAKGCKKAVCQFLHTADVKSTSNLWRYVKTCCGIKTLKAADHAQDVNVACDTLGKHKGRSITAVFVRATT